MQATHAETIMTHPGPGLGPYALRAARHWQDFLPDQYAQIPPPDREAFFSRIGTEIEQRIQARTDQLTPDDPAGTAQPPDYLAGLARLMTARAEAEQQVLDEMLPAPPDPEDPQDAEGTPGS